MKQERNQERNRMKKWTRLITTLLALGVVLTSCAHKKADPQGVESAVSSPRNSSSYLTSAPSSDEGKDTLSTTSDLIDTSPSLTEEDPITEVSDDLKDGNPFMPEIAPDNTGAEGAKVDIVSDDTSVSNTDLSSIYSIDAKLWSGVFPRTLLFDKGSSIDTESESSFYFLKDPKNTDWGYIRISINEESETQYRTVLKCYVSLQDYSDGKLPVTNIGGLDFISYTRKNMGKQIDLYETVYFYRDENSGMTIRIVVGSNTDECDSVFENLQFHLPDYGLADMPFPWNVEAVDTPSKPVEFDDYLVVPEQLHFSERVFTASSSNGVLPIPSTASHVAVLGDHLYTMDTERNIIRTYKIDEDRLLLEKEEQLTLAATTANSVVADDLIRYTMRLAGNTYSLFTKGRDSDQVFNLNSSIATSPDGKTALSYSYADLKVNSLAIENGQIVLTPFELEFPRTDLHILNMSVTDNYIFTDCQDDEYEYHAYMFDKTGHYINELKDSDGNYVSTYCFCEYDRKVIAPSIVENKLLMWTKYGLYVDSVSTTELFGLPVRDINRVLYPSLSMVPAGPDNPRVFYVVFSWDTYGVGEDLAFRLTFATKAEDENQG